MKPNTSYRNPLFKELKTNNDNKRTTLSSSNQPHVVFEFSFSPARHKFTVSIGICDFDRCACFPIMCEQNGKQAYTNSILPQTSACHRRSLASSLTIDFAHCSITKTLAMEIFPSLPLNVSVREWVLGVGKR